RFGDRDGQQRALAQQLPHVLRRVALEDAFLLASCRVERHIFKGTHGGSARGWPEAYVALSGHGLPATGYRLLHQSSRVTRSTSSIVVSPRSTRARPSSRIDGVI